MNHARSTEGVFLSQAAFLSTLFLEKKWCVKTANGLGRLEAIMQSRLICSVNEYPVVGAKDLGDWLQ